MPPSMLSSVPSAALLNMLPLMLVVPRVKPHEQPIGDLFEGTNLADGWRPSSNCKPSVLCAVHLASPVPVHVEGLCRVPLEHTLAPRGSGRGAARVYRSARYHLD